MKRQRQGFKTVLAARLRLGEWGNSERTTNMRLAKRIRIWIIALFLTASSLFAHGDLDIQIAEASSAIAKDPGNPSLYLERGELHRFHHDWKAALEDYAHADLLAPNLPQIELCRASLYFDAEMFKEALQSTDALLKREHHHAVGHALRARVLVRLGRPQDSIGDFNKAIEFGALDQPELHVERARALVAWGPEHVDEALQGLEQGLKKLRYVITLQLAALDIERAAGRSEAALLRVTFISEKLIRKETWLSVRGDILHDGGRRREASEAYQQALSALVSLPAFTRSTRSMQELESHIRNRLGEQVDAKETAQANGKTGGQK